jgi:CubicO group peptidase (beta-lactamase class C family)
VKVSYESISARAPKIDSVVEPMLLASRAPGASVAIVVGEQTVFAKGYGYRDWHAKLPMTASTAYPIASTSKAMNATLLGMLVDEGRLSWDAPVKDYLPGFRLKDPCISAQVTVRDLITMRTGLPRHDWVWTGCPITRAELVERLRYLDLSAGLRERFQYSNVTTTVSGHIAEVITGRNWEDLVRERIFQPLDMHATEFAMPTSGNVTLAYHENSRREILLTRRLKTDITAPSGGAIHSTVEDMTRWMAFNLRGQLAGRSLVRTQTLQEIHRVQMAVQDPAAPKPRANYAMGWTVDVYNSCVRLAHGGYIHDVNSEVTLFPAQGIAIVSFANFSSALPAMLINEHVFDVLMGFTPERTLEGILADYEKKVHDTLRQCASVRRAENTSPSHSLGDYAGVYVHKGYGQIEILQSDGELVLRRYELTLPLEHWHYDVWAFVDAELFPIEAPHAFDRANRVLFETNVDGEVTALSLSLEPTVAPIRFEKTVTETSRHERDMTP